MKRFLLLTPLTFAVLLLSACPDAKLPTPAPKVPEPKVDSAMLHSPPALEALNRNPGEAPVSRPA